MKNLILNSILLFIICNKEYAQISLVKDWDYRFGGTSSDRFSNVLKTSDEGFLIGGSSNSGVSGDKSDPNWDLSNIDYDYWIVKINSVGMKQWDKRFGGLNSDKLYALQKTNDDGFILGGISFSNISGDKSQPSWGNGDYWIVKIDSSGNKIWDKRFGGTEQDELHSLQQTSDGGYILGGWTASGISGDLTQPSLGSWDYWIIKIDSNGIKQWDKRYGGTGGDWLSMIIQTMDNNYLISGTSNSEISGDKTEPSWGEEDFWIIKTDSLGNKIWDKSFGGLYFDGASAIATSYDNDYIIGGISYSGIDGNKTVPSWGLADLWLVKVDENGNKIWDKAYGGNDYDDEFGNILQTSDSGYLFAGISSSNISGNKSENNLGFQETWFVRTDSVGNKKSDKTVFTTGYESDSRIILLSNNCYAIVSTSYSDTGGYKTQSSWGASDYWIIKFCDSTLTTIVNEISNLNTQLNISPNPFTTGISITFLKQNFKEASIAIYDLIGAKVLQMPNLKPQTEIDLSFLPKGIYMAEVNIDGKMMNKKLVKQ